MDDAIAEGPRTFISYSWSSQEHESWVLQLATELEESGINVVLDKWDLKEGADKFAFMEKMVTDPTLRRVVVVCDRVYSEKADGRTGGVGTETQIISKELYDQVDVTDQKQKFVAVITEKDEEGKPYVPTFLRNRIYIDMSDDSLRAQNFDQLLRWIYDKPLHKRPVRGKPPLHILTAGGMSLGTSSRFRFAIEALRQGRTSALGAVNDYFDTFVRNLKIFQIEPQDGKEFDEEVIESLDAFLPWRDEAIDLILAIARFHPSSEMYKAIHTFFENLLPYRLPPGKQHNPDDPSADNFKFILNELFLYATAALLKQGKFDGVNQLTGRGYYLPTSSPERSDGGYIGYTIFRGYLPSLNYRNRRLQNVQQHNLMAELLRDRNKRSDPNFDEIMQADFILYLRDELTSDDKLNFGRSWFPYTLVFAPRWRLPFELFIRAESVTFFDQFKVALGIANKEALERLLQDFAENKRESVRFGMFDHLRPATLIGFDRLCTIP